MGGKWWKQKHYMTLPPPEPEANGGNKSTIYIFSFVEDNMACVLDETLQGKYFIKHIPIIFTL